MTWIKQHKIIALISVLAYGFFVAIFSIRINDKQIILKGDLTSVAEGVSINGAELNPDFYTIYVLSLDRPTLFQYAIALLNQEIDIADIHSGYDGYTLEDYFIMGQIDEALSFQNAIMTAYDKASDIDSTISVDAILQGYYITYIDKRQSGLEIGDLVVGVNDLDARFTEKNEFFGVFSNHDRVTISVLRHNQRISKEISTLDSGLYGIAMEPKYQLTTTPVVTNAFDDDLVGGPSGGLIQTLDIYTTLLNIDLEGLKVTGTGTISSDGIVGPIGGIKQKIFTAADNDVDLFFVPNENYLDALVAYNTLKDPAFELIKVGDFDEAVEALLVRLSNG
ncbi:MAG: hypothetical protein CVV63_04055 [Tenericutes bacterium HGW-Tenericutes-8]|nr:MAG: hypothetical protein CVV63_04055 [Tenericutes bacterium HGW-Tenericutes-8]